MVDCCLLCVVFASLENSAQKIEIGLRVVPYIWRVSVKLRASRPIPIVASGMFSTRYVGSTMRRPRFFGRELSTQVQMLSSQLYVYAILVVQQRHHVIVSMTD